MSRVIVIGAGPMGLAAAYWAVTLGHEVTLLEADSVPGGMAAHFDFGELSIERFYHFICKSDRHTFSLLDELGVSDKLRWSKTNMSYFFEGKIHKWGDPISLLTFPHLSLLAKIRTGLQMFWTTKRKNFESIEKMTARQWIERGSGKEVYNKLWKRLLELKFYEMADEISASWIATRIKRIGNSRLSIFQEELGFLEGGSQTLVDALTSAFIEKGGRLQLGSKVEKVEIKNGRVIGVATEGQFFEADNVISTVPTPLISQIVPDLSQETLQKYDAIRNIGVVCLLFNLKKSVTRNFWLNIVDQNVEIPGIIEFSNLRPIDNTVVYVPYYMPTTQQKWNWSDKKFIDEAFGYIQKINPQINQDDLIDTAVCRLRYAQPVCEPNFQEKLPPIQTEVNGLQIADTSYYYPEDRGISESLNLGKLMAQSIHQ